MVRFIRRLVQVPLTDTGVRLIDVVIYPIGMVVAIIVCLPILAVTLVVGAGLGALLHELGAPDAVTAGTGLVAFGLGLTLGFIALVRIYRRLPASIRAWVAPEDETVEAAVPASPVDVDADAATFEARIAAADARLSSDPVRSIDPGT